ncbi:PB1 domain-containing [Olea europaea subsp. europaea]|uniref:PB1 domain-containing n=1 Tax=Olea europaea subsp. europaea TaxID=158383 RepID=A0A8S0QUR0_OLEEU|nr:PB1 domain-containing [Olea europaea subsp. europaea]
MNQASTSDTIKFLYSYGGRIVPRSTKGHDGMVRYDGGHTRVLAVDRSISFAELMVKFGDSCGYLVDLNCKLPNHDLDELVSIKSDQELKALIEEYDGASPGEKIRAVLFPISVKKISPPSSPMSCFDFPSGLPVIQYSAVGKSKYRCYEGWSPRHLHFMTRSNYPQFH